MSECRPSRHFATLRTLVAIEHSGHCPDLPLANPVANAPRADIVSRNLCLIDVLA